MNEMNDISRMDGVEIKKTCCGICNQYSHCGIDAYVRDGRIIHVEGSADNPHTCGKLCPRGAAIRQYVYNKDRILYPMRRAKEDRGKDKWERVTWDEALDIIYDEVHKIWDNYGPESIFVSQGTGRQASIYGPPLANACFKTPNISFMMSGSSCYGPRTVVADFLLGAGYPELDYAQFFGDRYDDPEYELPK